MEVDGASSVLQEGTEISNPFETLIRNLASNDKVVCKSQQRGESDFTTDEKVAMLSEILTQNKATFLFRFGEFLNSEQLKLFEQFQCHSEAHETEVKYQLKRITRFNSKQVRNRRYVAIKRLEKDYFSEKEMRKRNPLLYEQLIGLYLSSREKKMRDVQERNDQTFVSLLMDGIDKEEEEKQRIRQEAAEEAEMDDSDVSDDESEQGSFNNSAAFPCSSTNDENVKISRVFWGEIQGDDAPRKIKKPMTDAQLSITAPERRMLKEEFYNTMFESFIDGKDDFDYDSIDNNEEYDNLEIVERDEEEKYFDADDPEDVVEPLQNNQAESDASEDELDIYMNALSQNRINTLAEAMKKL